MDKVSIITSTYNSASYINLMIDSILAQTSGNWELVITDDCSTDNTWHILKYYCKHDSRIKIFRLSKNSGPAISRNNSIAHSTGRFIAFCDSDDLWEPTKLKEQLMFQRKHNLELTYSYYKLINSNGKIIGSVKSPKFLNYNIMLMNDFIGFLTVIYDTKRLGKIYLPSIKKRQDWALLILLYKNKVRGGCIKKYLAKYRVHDLSISNNKIGLIKYIFKVYYSILRLGVVTSSFLLMQYPFIYLFKRIMFYRRNT